MNLAQIKNLIPQGVRSTAGRTIRNFRRKPESNVGVDFINDVKSRLPHLVVKNVFDVGAHVGITALEFSDAFPRAKVYAFEPSAMNFKRLNANLVGKPDIKKYQIAFGESQATRSLLVDPKHPSMARIVSDYGAEKIVVDTVDHFCELAHLHEIDLIKIDTEGHEIQVLSGARRLLATGSIMVVKAECAMDPDNSYHTPFADLCALLFPLGYRLFGFYEQSESTLEPDPKLRRFDAAFISSKYRRVSAPHDLNLAPGAID